MNTKLLYSIAICTNMQHDIQELLEHLISLSCHEIMLIGNSGQTFSLATSFNDKRIKLFYTEPDLASKRNGAIEKASGDIIVFLDDDAIPGPDWWNSIQHAFADPETIAFSGPSLLPPDSSMTTRIIQKAIGSTTHSDKRYNARPVNTIEWYEVIGANLAFRLSSLQESGGCPSLFQREGDDLAMAWNISQGEGNIAYSPDGFVYHPPHSLLQQCKQIFRWGKAARRLKLYGANRPSSSIRLTWALPLVLIFSCIYAAGYFTELLAPKHGLE